MSKLLAGLGILMALLYVGGEQLNHIAEGLSVTPTPAADALFPIGNLSDLNPETLFRFATLQANSQIVANLERVTNGGFESGLTGWTDDSAGTGTTSEETSTVHSGAKSMKLDAGASGDEAASYQDLTVRSGARLRLSWWGNVPSGQLRISRQNLQTGRYWNAATEAWQDSVSESVTLTASWVQSVHDLQMESMAVALEPLVTLRIRFRGSPALGNLAYLDDVSLVPATNFAVFVAHGIDSRIVPEIRSSNDSFASNDVLEATMTPKRLAFYSHMSTRVYKRHWKAKLVGQNSAGSGAPWFGQWILADVETIARKQNHGWTLDLADAQSRLRTPSGAQSVTQLGGGERTDLSLDFKHYAESQENEVRDDILARCGYGTHPLLIVPDDTRGDVVLGRLTDRWSRTRRWSGISDSRLDIEGMPYGQMID